MRALVHLLLTAAFLAGAGNAWSQQAAGPSPAAGFDLHVVAPHVVEGVQRGPFHHYCKAVSPEPILQCLIFESTEPGAPMTQVEYMVAKSLTRSTVAREDWNRDWHDHAVEIAGGRVQILGLPEEEAAATAEVAKTTDGVIFHLWPHGSRIPTGRVTVAQAVGHQALGEVEYAASHAPASPTE